MEGPSLFLASEQLAEFKRKKVKVVSGNTKIGKERLLGKEVKDIYPWGKHLVLQFDNFAIRIHFLLFGTFEAEVNGNSVTGDYKRSREPRLYIEFENGNIKMFNCSIKLFETEDLKSTYDYSIDIMSDQWNTEKATRNIIEHPKEEIADILLDQEIFAGVGNIIKNEVLSLVGINPKTKIENVTKEQIQKIIETTQKFSHQFYVWRKEFQLRANLKIHRKGNCPICGNKIIREKTGKRQRWSYYCSLCQPDVGNNNMVS